LVPSLHENTDKLLYDSIWEDVWELSSDGTDKIKVKTEHQGEVETLAYEFALFMTSSIKMARPRSPGS
jgi:hypothetical protein